MIKIGLKGHYTLNVLRADGSTKSTHDFDNLITDIGLNAKGTRVDTFDICMVGTSATSPATTDTQMGALLASTNSVIGNANGNGGTPDYIGFMNITYDFGLGNVVGTIAEVGIGWGTGANQLFSHARILDGAGSPTTISILIDEQLQIVYRFEQIPDLTTQYTGSVVIDAITYNWTGRAGSVASSNAVGFKIAAPFATAASVYETATLCAVTGTPSGAGDTHDTVAPITYSNNSLVADTKFTFGLTKGNFGTGVGSIYFQALNGTAQFHIVFDAQIPKTSIKVMSLTVRVGWDRA